MLYILTDLTCEGLTIPVLIVNLVYYAILAIKIFVPLVLIVFGMMDLAKAVMAQDDKIMKESQKRLISRIIYAVLVFLIISLVQMVFTFLGNADKDSETGQSGSMKCVSCLINGKTGAANSCGR